MSMCPLSSRQSGPGVMSDCRSDEQKYSDSDEDDDFSYVDSLDFRIGKGDENRPSLEARNSDVTHNPEEKNSDSDDDDDWSLWSVDSLDFRDGKGHENRPSLEARNSAATHNPEEKNSDSDEDDDWSVDSLDLRNGTAERPSAEEKKQRKMEVKEWVESRRDFVGLVDTTEAVFLEIAEHYPIPPELLYGLKGMMIQCRFKNCLSYFNHPNENIEGGVTAFTLSKLSSKQQMRYTTITLKAIRQYNSKTNSHSKLELVSTTRVAQLLGYGGLYNMFITFTACRDGQIGTYQAAVANYFDEDTFLILLREVEKDKILAYMSIPWVPEKWRMMY